MDHLEEKIRQLEKRVDKLERDAYKARVDKLEHAVFNEKESFEVRRIQEEREYEEPYKPGPFITWLKTDWLMKLGAFLLLLALGWFVTYAFANNWIGPVGRITLGIVAGAAVMGFGHKLFEKMRGPAQVLVVLGGVMILLTVFAARSFYDFFDPLTALGVMSLVIIAMAIMAIIHDSKGIAYPALLGGMVVPLLVASPQPDYLSLMSYIFLLDLGVLTIVSLRPWRGLIVLALILTGFYSFTFADLPDKQVWIFMALFFGLFFLSTLFAVLRAKKATGADLIVSALNGLILLGWIHAFVPKDWASILLSATVLLLAGVSYILMKASDLKVLVYINTGLAILFIGAATAFELNGAQLVTAYALEAFLIVILARYALNSERSPYYFSLLQAIPIAFSLPHLLQFQHEKNLFNEHFFSILAVILSLSLTAFFLYKIKEESLMFLASFHAVIAVLFSIAMIWLVSHNLIETISIARGVALVIYTIIGIALFFFGVRNGQKVFTYSGGILLGGVVLRLLFVEVWDMALAGRVVTFFVIGLLLTVTAFFQKRLH